MSIPSYRPTLNRREEGMGRQRFIGPAERRRRITLAARDSGISLTKLAKNMGVRYGSLYKTLRNEDIKLSTLKKIARELDVSISYLVEL